MGNRIVDFSYCGYRSSNSGLPFVPAVLVVHPVQGDATSLIQSALDHVAALPLDGQGFRGAVLLAPGIFRLSSGLKMIASGVVLRGSGSGNAGTVLLAEGETRETVIRMKGNAPNVSQTVYELTDDYVGVGSRILEVNTTKSLQAGDRIRITRPCTREWIAALGMENFGGETDWIGWKPGQRIVQWIRTIQDIQGRRITLDQGLTTALEQNFGGALVHKIDSKDQVNNLAVENLSIRSTYDPENPLDEAHRWMGITMENVEDAWVRQVNFQHLAGSAVAILSGSRKVTVENCKSLEPVSEKAAQRRYSFYTEGEQTLFLSCYAEYGYHAFSVGFMSPGPNAFVQCTSYLPLSFSGAIDSWASGTLFDNVHIDGGALSLINRGQDGKGAGWAAANSVLWQCSAARVENQSPPTASNYAFGIWSQFNGNGYWEQMNEHIKPRSLFYAQLAQRLGGDFDPSGQLMPTEAGATSSPSQEQAEELTLAAAIPPLQLAEWIDGAAGRHPIAISQEGLIRWVEPAPVSKALDSSLSLNTVQGWLLWNQGVVTGNVQEVPWWRGGIRPYELDKAQPHITRFVPGRYGAGLTDELKDMTDTLKKQNIRVVDHHYGLWYDRRRDDHERIRRMDAEVWPPFYEQPFARSGKGLAWDQLSQYDLSKYNTWYWNRLASFADLADEKGLVLLHQHYFQHNILEAGAHYADFPWRTANNINEVGFPEPPPYAGDKRIFLDEQFYDLRNKKRLDLHRAYIRKCLENFKNHGTVLHLISSEYTGPLHFVQFWLETIGAWEQETGRNALVALSVTKDVQDAILTDPLLGKLVDVIDIRYWHQRVDGSFYAPKGGQHLALRQHARLEKPGKVDFRSVYEGVRAYRAAYPDKPVCYYGAGYDQYGWAVLMAGGSLPALPKGVPNGLLKAISAMRPDPGSDLMEEGYVLSELGTQALIYRQTSDKASYLDLSEWKGKFMLQSIDLNTGRMVDGPAPVKGGQKIPFPSAVKNTGLWWLYKQK